MMNGWESSASENTFPSCWLFSQIRGAKFSGVMPFSASRPRSQGSMRPPGA
ncbi:hypothetical protein D3C78_1922740 [compost metagenome]